MTAADLLTAYPSAQVAVAWCELMLAASELDDGDVFAEMRKYPKITVDDAVKLLRETIREAVEVGQIYPRGLEQTYNSDFRRYVAGKFGMV